jgi:hypothetical protein
VGLHDYCIPETVSNLLVLLSSGPSRYYMLILLPSENIACRNTNTTSPVRLAGHVARVGERRGVYKILLGKPEGKRPLGSPRHRWVDNIKMNLQEVGCWECGLD